MWGLRASPARTSISFFPTTAAELFAGTLQAHGRAIVVGEKTYGKAQVRTLTAGAFVEAGRYRLPGGQEVASAGVQPDVDALPKEWPEVLPSYREAGGIIEKRDAT